MRHASLFAAILFPTLAIGCSAAPDESTRSIDDDLYYLQNTRWANGYVPVCWVSPKPEDEYKRAWVVNAVDRTWGQAANITFAEWGTCTTGSHGVHISIADTTDAPHTTQLGDDLNGLAGGMVLNFTFKNWSPTCQSKVEYCIRAIAVHEFGHALGFAHEQNRPDTPSTCKDAPQGHNGDMTLGPWDPDSVMNYCNAEWNNLGALSPGDIAGVQRIYGRKPSGSLVGIGGKCLDVEGNVNASGTRTWMWDCHGTANQQWRPGFQGGAMLGLGGHCFHGVGNYEGTPTEISDCVNAEAWKYQNFAIKGYGGKCLDVPFGSTTPGTAVQMYACNGGTNQHFSLSATGEIRTQNGMCVHTQGDGTTTGTNVVVAYCNGAQKWNVQGGGAIVLNGASKCLDVRGLGTADHTGVQIYDCNGGLNQKWSFAGALVGPSGKCLDIVGASTLTTKETQAWSCDGYDSQVFEFYP